MKFKDIIGQKELKSQLIQSVKDNRVSHAQLFIGDEGRGKLAMAIAYAQFVSCTDKQEDDSCGKCLSCVKYNKLAHPDLHFIFPTTSVKSKKTLSSNFIGPWREYVLENKGYASLTSWYKKINIENKQGIISAEDCNEIIQKLSLKSYESEFKILIIWMADKIYPTAAPKILKALEEPPEKTLFLLITENPDRILKTIISRTQRVFFAPITETEIGKNIALNSDLNDLEIQKITKHANGNWRAALEFADDNDLSDEFFERYQNMMRMSYAYKLPDLLEISRDLSSQGREWLKRYLSFCTLASQRSFYMSLQQRELVNATEEEKEFYGKIAPFINAEKIAGFRDIFERAQFHITRNGNARLVLTDMLLELSRWFKK